MFLASTAQPVRRADNLPPSVSRLSNNVGSLTSHNPIGLHGLLLLLFFTFLVNTAVAHSDSFLQNSSLTRGRVCILKSLLDFASSVILVSESRRTHDNILLFQIRDDPNLEGQVSVSISPPEQGDPVIIPGTGFSSRWLLRLAGLRWRYSTSQGVF
jgi:hypothetical protein